MYILAYVKLGSTMTRSPDLVVLIHFRGSLASYCSAINGEIFDLNPPVPTPKMMRPTMKRPSAAFGRTISGGIEAMRRKTWPTMAMKMDHKMVL